MADNSRLATAERPRVWLNVTNSVGWSGRVVGIIRVERSLARALAEVCDPGELRFCTWDDGGFREYCGSPWLAREECAPHPESSGETGAIEVTGRRDALRSLALVVLSLLPGFIMRPLYRLLSRLRRLVRYRGKADRNPDANGPGVTVDDAPVPVAPFEPGDVLVSLGIDWKMRYTGCLPAIRDHYGVRVANCVHDLVPILYPHYARPGIPEVFGDYMRSLVRASDLLLCVSRNTQRDLECFIRDEAADARPRIAVIRHGDDVPSGEGDIREAVERLGSAEFILYVSTVERRKNHEVLCRAYQLLAAEKRAGIVPRLVFAGGVGWGVDDLIDDIRIDPALRDRVTIFEDLNDAELLFLYREAMFCVYPSFYEGWGLPVAEALTLGKPVLCSHAGSLPEVGGDAVRYLSPWSPREWADAIVELANDATALDELTSRAATRYVSGSWEDCAVAVRDAVLEAVRSPGLRGAAPNS